MKIKTQVFNSYNNLMIKFYYFSMNKIKYFSLTKLIF